MAPKEHGAWAILIAPVAVGLFAASSFAPVAAALFCLGALGAFLVRTPLQALLADRREPRARRWLALYGALAFAGFAPLLRERPLLLAFAVPALLVLIENITANRSGRRFSALNEALGVAGLCLGAPAAAYAVSGRLEPRAWEAWALCAAFFAGPIFHVKAAALAHRAAGDIKLLPALRRMRVASVVYHALAFVAVAAWAARGVAALPFAAALAKTLASAARPPQRADFRALGFAEVGYSLFFVAITAYALRP